MFVSMHRTPSAWHGQVFAPISPNYVYIPKFHLGNLVRGGGGGGGGERACINNKLIGQNGQRIISCSYLYNIIVFAHGTVTN